MDDAFERFVHRLEELCNTGREAEARQAVARFCALCAIGAQR